PRLAGGVVLVGALAGALFAGDSTNPKKGAAGGGRGLGALGGPALTTVGGRPLPTLGDRRPDRLSDIPLPPPGGLVPGGVSLSDHGSSGSSRGHSSSHHHFGVTDSFVPMAAAGSPVSEVSIGSFFADDDGDDSALLLMPRVELPVIVLDHRPAL